MFTTVNQARTAKEFVMQQTSGRTACFKDRYAGQSSYYVRDAHSRIIGRGACARKAWSDAATFLRSLPAATDRAPTQANHRSPFGPGA